MTELWNIIILAVLQGLTEFLPVSSSGHLAVASRLLGLKDGNMMVIVSLHAGTFLSILIFYFRELIKLADSGRRKLLFSVLIGSIPIGCAGVIFEFSGIMDYFFANLYTAGIGLCVTGTVLSFAMRHTEENTQTADDMTFKDAFLIGLAQVPALFPGISRSGSTISAGLKRRLKPEEAAWFSFLLALPAIAGASLLEPLAAYYKGEGITAGIPFVDILVGFAVSAIVGYIAIKLLFVSLKKRSFTGYAVYCFFLGVSIIIWSLTN